MDKDKYKQLIDANLARQIDRLELRAPMVAALARLKRKTVRGLVALRPCDLWDALDEDATLSEDEKYAVIAQTKSILAEMGLQLNADTRFESFDEMSTWVRVAAAELGLRVEEQDRRRRCVVIFIPLEGEMVGEVYIERTFPYREDLNGATDCMARARSVLRRASELASVD